MKKLFSWLTVFMLALSLAVPASASNADMPPLPDYDKGEYPYAVILFVNNSYSLFASKEPCIYRTDKVLGYSANVSLLSAYTVNNNTEWTDVTSQTAQRFDASWELLWANHNIINQATGDIYYEVASCDGTSCSATDVNIDGICDNCGMVLMSLSRSPVAPDVTGSNKNYVMFYSGTVYKYTAYTSDESYTIRGEEYGARYRTYTDPSVTVQRYESYDGINWEQTYTGKTANDYPGEIGYELISSTFDWYTEEGDRFFPVPLWEEVQTVTQGEMGNLTSETAGTMKTLVVCGVGLTACLMALSLFGKRWLLFLR